MSASSATSTQGALLLPEAKRCRVVPGDDASVCAPTASTFTERCANDSVTLSLVLGCLDVYSILRARRVCRTWQAATRAPLTWSHCALAVHAQHVAGIPASSVALLRHLTVAFSCECECNQMHMLANMSLNQRGLLEWVGQLRGLRSLCVRGVVIDAELCNMLSVHAAGIRELDLTLCVEGEEGDAVSDPLSDDENSSRYQTKRRDLLRVQSMGPLDSSSANNDAHDAQDGLLSAAATSASRDVKDAMVHMRLPPAADDRPLPVLRLLHLTSLRLPVSSSYRDVLTLIAPLHKLQSLQLRRFGMCSVDTAVGERHYLALMNRLFAHTYADTLTHLALSNLHAHGLGSYRFELLHNLTHLSLKQDQICGGLTCAALHAVAALPRLERCEIYVEDMAFGLCVDPEWWQALAGVRSLVTLSVSGYISSLDQNMRSGTSTAMIVYLGLEHVICNSDIRLGKLRLRVLLLMHVGRLLELDYPHLHTLVVCTDACVASAASLARMPRLTSLEMMGPTRDASGMVTLLQALPKLRTLKCGPTITRALSPPYNPDAWRALVNMPALTSLQLDSTWQSGGTWRLSDNLVGMWCDAATSRPPPPDAMRAFMGGALSDRGSTPQLALQYLRFDSDVITPDQCHRLLRSMPQLQLLSVRYSNKFATYPSCARLFVDADYE